MSNLRGWDGELLDPNAAMVEVSAAVAKATGGFSRGITIGVDDSNTLSVTKDGDTLLRYNLSTDRVIEGSLESVGMSVEICHELDDILN